VSRIDNVQKTRVAVDQTMRKLLKKIYLSATMPLHGYSRQLREEVLANYLFFSHCSIAAAWQMQHDVAH
jgi:hypothetical protein